MRHVDPTGDEVGPAGAATPSLGSSAAATHTCSSRDGGLLGLDVGGAVLEAEEVAGRGLRWWRWSTYVRSRAATTGPTTVPKPMRARLRTACTATCGSSAQAWMQRSPPDRAGSRMSPGKCGSSRSAFGLPVGDAEAVRALGVAEQRRAEAEGDRQAARTAGRAPPRCRRAAGWYVAVDGADSPARLAPASSARPRRSTPRAGRRARRGSSVEHVERGEVQPVLRRGDDAGLVRAAEGVRSPTRRPRPPTPCRPRPGRGPSYALRRRRRADAGRAGDSPPPTAGPAC